MRRLLPLLTLCILHHYAQCHAIGKTIHQASDTGISDTSFREKVVTVTGNDVVIEVSDDDEINTDSHFEQEGSDTIINLGEEKEAEYHTKENPNVAENRQEIKIDVGERDNGNADRDGTEGNIGSQSTLVHRNPGAETSNGATNVEVKETHPHILTASSKSYNSKDGISQPLYTESKSSDVIIEPQRNIVPGENTDIISHDNDFNFNDATLLTIQPGTNETGNDEENATVVSDFDLNETKGLERENHAQVGNSAASLRGNATIRQFVSKNGDESVFNIVTPKNETSIVVPESTDVTRNETSTVKDEAISGEISTHNPSNTARDETIDLKTDATITDGPKNRNTGSVDTGSDKSSGEDGFWYEFHQDYRRQEKKKTSDKIEPELGFGIKFRSKPIDYRFHDEFFGYDTDPPKKVDDAVTLQWKETMEGMIDKMSRLLDDLNPCLVQKPNRTSSDTITTLTESNTHETGHDNLLDDTSIEKAIQNIEFEMNRFANFGRVICRGDGSRETEAIAGVHLVESNTAFRENSAVDQNNTHGEGIGTFVESNAGDYENSTTNDDDDKTRERNRVSNHYTGLDNTTNDGSNNNNNGADDDVNGNGTAISTGNDSHGNVEAHYNNHNLSSTIGNHRNEYTNQTNFSGTGDGDSAPSNVFGGNSSIRNNTSGSNRSSNTTVTTNNSNIGSGSETGKDTTGAGNTCEERPQNDGRIDTNDDVQEQPIKRRPKSPRSVDDGCEKKRSAALRQTNVCAGDTNSQDAIGRLCHQVKSLGAHTECMTSQLTTNQRKTFDNIKTMEDDIRNLKNSVAILKRTSVFYAEAPFGSSHVRDYKVKLSQGQGFKPTSGYFTAPYDGAYQITIGYHKRTPAADELINVMMDNRAIFRLRLDGTNQQRVFMTALKAGQSLWLKNSVKMANIIDSPDLDYVYFGAIFLN